MQSDLYILCSGSDSVCHPKERAMNKDPSQGSYQSAWETKFSTREGNSVGAGRRGESAKAFGELGPKVHHCTGAMCTTHKSDNKEEMERMSVCQGSCDAQWAFSCHPAMRTLTELEKMGRSGEGRDRVSRLQRSVQA